MLWNNNRSETPGAVSLLVQAQPATEHLGCLWIDTLQTAERGPESDSRNGVGEPGFLPKSSS